MINSIFADFINNICFVYLDDIIVYSNTAEEHIKRLAQVFQRIHENFLQIQPDKSEFFREKILYLGHVVSRQGIQPNEEKTIVLKTYPVPKSVKDIQKFLGLTGYYRRFIENYAKITKPLTQLLRKEEAFVWTDLQQQSFQELINILISDLILIHPNFNSTFYLNTDASQYVIGAVLQQKDTNGNLKPVSYASRTLNQAEINYSTIEKEALAIVWSTHHFRPYLLGRRFEILSDHRPLIWLFKANDPGSRLLRWRLKLEEYDYQISYIPGTQNVVADTLSRICHVNVVTRSKVAKAAIEEKKDPVPIPEHVAPLPTMDITKVSNILVFTTPDTIFSSPLTKDFAITGVKGEIFKHRVHQKTFFLIFYKQSEKETFSTVNMKSTLCILRDVLQKFKITEAAIYDEVNSSTKEELPNIERELRTRCSLQSESYP
jgi:hypothetical protein